MKRHLVIETIIIIFLGSLYTTNAQQTLPEPCKELPRFNDDFTLIDSTKAALGKEVGELATKITDFKESRIPKIEKLERDITSIDAEIGKLQAKPSLTDEEQRQFEGYAQSRKSAESFLDGMTSAKLKVDLKSLEDELSWRNAKLNCINGELAQMFSPQQSFKSQISLLFAGLIFVVIIGFFVIAYQDQSVRRAIFGGQTGLQFLTLFSIVIAIILFGITNILEGRELAALLGGLSGYILGKYNSPDGSGNGTQTTLNKIAKVIVTPVTSVLSSTSPNQQLSAVGVDNAGNDLPNGAFLWNSDNPTVATVDQVGLLTRVSAGVCNVTATSAGIVSNPCAVTCQE